MGIVPERRFNADRGGLQSTLLDRQLVDDPCLWREEEITAGGTVAYLCQTGSGRCHAYDRRTRSRHTFTLDLPVRPATDADWEYYRARMIARAPAAIRG